MKKKFKRTFKIREGIIANTGGRVIFWLARYFF